MDAQTLYTTPHLPASFSGLSTFKKTYFGRVKNTNSIKNLEAYNVYKKTNYKFPRRKVVVEGPHIHWQMDFVDIRNLKTVNSYFSYILTVIDAFTRYAWAVPMKDKQAKSTAQALRSIFEKQSINKCPRYIYMRTGEMNLRPSAVICLKNTILYL